MELKGSKTEANLMAAFAGESQARNRYSFFASVARKARYEQIADIFEETAKNEREHAKLLLRAAGGLKGKTLDNGREAAAGENYEWTSMYPGFAAEARAEGFGDVAALFDKIAAVEAHHDARYNELADNVKNETVFKKPASVKWVCAVCGHIHEGPEAPGVCPLCSHPQAFFSRLVEEY